VNDGSASATTRWRSPHLRLRQVPVKGVRKMRFSRATVAQQAGRIVPVDPVGLAQFQHARLAQARREREVEVGNPPCLPGILPARSGR